MSLYDADHTLTLIADADTTHEDARDWYDAYGWSIYTEHAGSVDLQAVEYDWLDDVDDAAVVRRVMADDSDILLHEAEAIVARARLVREAAETIDSLLDEAVDAYDRGDLRACVEALENASREEAEHGDDPATSQLAGQLILVH